MRRQFDLLEEDQAFLDSLGLPWEAIFEGSTRWILVHEHMVHEAFLPKKVSLAICITGGYPRAQLDMVYFNPAVARRDGQPIGALASARIDGKVWQRWSRHRTPQHPWREGVDNLSTHFALIEHWFDREVKLKPPHGVPA